MKPRFTTSPPRKLCRMHGERIIQGVRDDMGEVKYKALQVAESKVALRKAFDATPTGWKISKAVSDYNRAEQWVEYAFYYEEDPIQGELDV